MTAEVAGIGVRTSGFYDLSAFRADADVMVWWHGHTPEAVQAASRMLRRTTAGRSLTRSWGAMGVHRSAEFNRDHIPALLAGAPPKAWSTVYPFVRSYDWYLLPADQRRDMLIEHGMLGHDYPQVLRPVRRLPPQAARLSGVVGCECSAVLRVDRPGNL